MNRSPWFSSPVRIGSPVLVVAALASWAVVRAAGNLTAAVALTGLLGVVTFALSLTGLFSPRRQRTMATGLILVGAAAVLACSHEAVAARTSFLVICGTGLFLAAEGADRALGKRRGVQYRPGVDRWGPLWVAGVALAAESLSYLTIAARGVLAGGGPAALVAGTLAATLVAFLALLLATRARSSS